MFCKKISLFFIMSILLTSPGFSYPIDGYMLTGIKRLFRLQLIVEGKLKDQMPVPGALKKTEEIKLTLYQNELGKQIEGIPEIDPDFQKKISSLFPRLDESYSICVLDISPEKPVRYAERQPLRGFQPGSVGKLAVLTGLFCELENLFLDSFENRRDLLKNRVVKGGPWAVYDSHTVPFYYPETGKFVKRQVTEKDTFTLYEWVDHMLSVSNNGAASVVWREALLMRVFGQKYLTLTEEEANAFFKNTSKSELADLAVSVVNEPLRNMGISEDEWRLGTMFTRGATGIIPGKGGSLGTPKGLMKFLIHLEKGEIIDPTTSLEMKRLMYMTDRRIRYAANNSLKEAAVYFKSGSLYKCREEPGYNCVKYAGNKENYMNSVAIVEHGDSIQYMVTLMSNVLKKNSNSDHNALAGKIDKIIRE
ncbi:MAG: serine hydrolase [Saprospiraceae bacterium]